MLSTSSASRSACLSQEVTPSRSSPVSSAYTSSPSTASSTCYRTTPASESNYTSPSTHSDRASFRSLVSTCDKETSDVASNTVSLTVPKTMSEAGWIGPSTATAPTGPFHSTCTDHEPANKTRRTETGSTSHQSMASSADTARQPSLTRSRRSHSPSSASQVSESHRDAHIELPNIQHQHTASARAAPQSPRSRINSTSLDDSPSTFGTGASAASSSGGPSVFSNSAVDVSPQQASRLPKMDLAKHPPQELLKVLATLLHEIAIANDDFQPDKDELKRNRRGPRSRDRSTPSTPAEGDAKRDFQMPQGSHLSFSDSRRPSVTTAALGALATPSSTLCFHARNVPSISIESYLLRILKYCPTTNEVFLSLLIYFDRMSRMGSGAKPGAVSDGELAGEAAGLPRAAGRLDRGTDFLNANVSHEDRPYTHPGIRGFAIDSYNVHRLVIAGVTVASKFFSDVFYTNSRYAKVGGLPPHELNQLELQFLLLNDFRLTIPLEEMQRYADQLLMYGSGRAADPKIFKEPGSMPRTTSDSMDHNVVVTSSAHKAELDSQGDVQMDEAA